LGTELYQGTNLADGPRKFSSLQSRLAISVLGDSPSVSR
jgi:hypothetical protein